MTATSHLTGKQIHRYTHIHQGPDDLVKKIQMLRLLGQATGTCFQRCVGLDALNTMYAVTYEIDEANGTDYHERFKKYLTYVQEEDLMLAGAMTDPKGHRAKKPGEQADPDQYVRVVEQRPDGVVIRGAKLHNTGGINSHEILVLSGHGHAARRGGVRDRLRGPGGRRRAWCSCSAVSPTTPASSRRAATSATPASVSSAARR